MLQQRGGEKREERHKSRATQTESEFNNSTVDVMFIYDQGYRLALNFSVLSKMCRTRM